MNLAGMILLGAGVFSVCGAVCDWDWFINSRKARAMVALLGRNGARAFYGLLGSGMSVLGLLSMLGVVDLAEFGRNGGSQSQSTTVMAENVDVPFADFMEDAAAAERLGEFVHFPKAKARIRQPIGFELGGESFEGFQHKESQTRVFINIVPKPYSTITAKQRTLAFTTKGQTFRGRQETMQNGRKSLLILGEQPGLRGLNVVWICSVEAGDKTLMLTVEIPKAAEAEYSAMLKAAILSAESEVERRGH